MFKLHLSVVIMSWIKLKYSILSESTSCFPIKFQHLAALIKKEE